MSAFDRLLERVLYRLQKRLRPQMIGGFEFARDKTGIRISNATHISHPGQLRLGNHVFVGHFNYVDCFRPVTIGDGVQITNYCSILTHSSHHSVRLHGSHYLEDAPHALRGLVEGPVEIGEYSYLGAHCVIMPNTKLGKGTLVGAFSYVKSGVYADHAILRGIPARVVGDTRQVDAAFLEEFPELRAKHYLSSDRG